MNRLALVTVISMLLLAACGSDDGGKGAESQMPVDGSADSFFSPTEHGEVMFGLNNEAELKEDAGYHAWTFTLTGEAQVKLVIIPHAANFDTVMYLYKNQESGNWGSYIAKNDDSGDNLWSALDETLSAGQYKVLVKGYKEKVRGSFALGAECSGDGCPGTTSECEIENKDQGEPGVGETCITAALAMLGSGVKTETAFFSTQDGLCSAPDHVRRAWQFYHDYMGEWMGEYFDEDIEDPDIDFGFDMESTEFVAGGWLMGVDYGGDESALSILFDATGAMMMYYHHNQSPWVEWSCLKAGEKDMSWESEWCISHLLRTYRTDVEPEGPTASSVKLADAAATLDAPVAAVLAKYRDDNELTDDDLVDVTVTKWVDFDSGGTVYQVDVKAEGKNDATYTVGVDDYDTYLYTVETGKGKEFPCSSLD